MGQRVKRAGRIGTTDKLAISIVIMLACGLLMSFFLSVYSIKNNYTGPLYCWSAIFAPIGTAASIVLAKVIDKNKAENTCNGKGIKYASAEAQNFDAKTSPLI